MANYIHLINKTKTEENIMKTNTQINKVTKYLATIALVSSFGFMGCQPDTVKEKIQQKVSVNEQMNSDELTNAAEQLFGPYTFMLAYKTAKMSVEKDPTAHHQLKLKLLP